MANENYPYNNINLNEYKISNKDSGIINTLRDDDIILNDECDEIVADEEAFFERNYDSCCEFETWEEEDMGKIKNFDRAQYKSDFDAVVTLINEGLLTNYNFNVSADWAFENVLSYLCLNNIPHQYHIVQSWGMSLITITFGDYAEYSYSFFSTYKEED